LAAAFPQDRLRIHPNWVWTVEEAIDVGRAIVDLNNDHFEGPCWGFGSHASLLQFVPITTATNAVVVTFVQLAQSIRHDLVDVVLLDTPFWGGL
jgi:glucarate dehydratase